MNHSCAIFTIILVLALPAVVAPHQERVILSMEAGTCLLRVEADDESHTLRLRVQPEYPACHVSKDAMQSVLRGAFSRTDPPRLEGTYSSLYIGRLIDFPWLSQYLAAEAYKDEGWNRERGKPVSMDINKYVGALLSRKEVAAKLEETFGNSGYSILSAIVEKVLVGGFRDVPLYQGEMATGRVPYDAQVWFMLEKR